MAASLDSGQPRPVDRQVPAELVACGALAGVGAVDQDRAAVGVASQVAHLPVAVKEGRGGRGDGVADGPWRPAQLRHQAVDVVGCPFGEGLPARSAIRGTSSGQPRRRSTVEHGVAEERPPQAGGRETHRVGPAPEPGRQLGQVVEERGVLVQGDRLVALGHEPVADVAHEQRRPPPVPAQAGAAPTTVWSIVGGRASSNPAAHTLHRAAGEVAERAGEPVVVDVHHLEHVALAVDLDPLERRARLGVARAERPAPGGARRSAPRPSRHRPRGQCRVAGHPPSLRPCRPRAPASRRRPHRVPARRRAARGTGGRRPGHRVGRPSEGRSRSPPRRPATGPRGTCASEHVPRQEARR